MGRVLFDTAAEVTVADQLREAILAALDHYYCPLGHGELAAYLQVEHGLTVAEADLPALVDAERRAHAAGEQRQVWICPTLLGYPILDELGVPADDSLVTRSDWELPQRVVGSEAVRQLWLTYRLCRDAGIYLQMQRPGVDLLVEQATMRASLLLPQGEVRARLYLTDDPDAETPPPWERLELSVRLMLWSEVAEDTFGPPLADLDQQRRHTQANYLARYLQGPTAQLFGDVRVPPA